jgi:DNA repair protein RecO (recombination protein O)
MSSREAVDLEPAFILHQRPYRNTSQLIECLTVNFGKVGLIARGSRRARSGQRALLQAFAPLRISWVRRGELANLVQVEPANAAYPLAGHRLLGAYYVSELVLKLMARDDPNPEIFECYRNCLDSLCHARSLPRALRVFEFELLRALGYGLDLSIDAATREPLDPGGRYTVDPEGMPRAVCGQDGYLGRDLISLRELVLDDEQSLRAARLILGRALDSQLDGRTLRTRDVLRDIVDRGLGD